MMLRIRSKCLHDSCTNLEVMEENKLNFYLGIRPSLGISVKFRKPATSMSGYLVIYVLAVILGLGTIGWFATPKGNQQT